MPESGIWRARFGSCQARCRAVSERAFVYEALPRRVGVGGGSLGSIGDGVGRLGAGRVFLIADAQAKAVAHDVVATLGDAVAARWDNVAQHVPVELAERARAAVGSSGAGVVVSVGGGSSTG